MKNKLENNLEKKAIIAGRLITGIGSTVLMTSGIYLSHKYGGQVDPEHAWIYASAFSLPAMLTGIGLGYILDNSFRKAGKKAEKKGNLKKLIETIANPLDYVGKSLTRINEKYPEFCRTTKEAISKTATILGFIGIFGLAGIAASMPESLDLFSSTKKQQEKLQNQSYSNFLNYDNDTSNALDSTEFYKFYKGAKK